MFSNLICKIRKFKTRLGFYLTQIRIVSIVKETTVETKTHGERKHTSYSWECKLMKPL